MAIEFYDDTDHDGLFDILGAAFYALSTIDASQRTTVPDEVQDFLDRLYANPSAVTLPWLQTVAGVPDGITAWQTNSTLTTAIRTSCELILRQFVADDGDQPQDTLEYALAYVVAQMAAGGYYVDDNALSIDHDPAGECPLVYTLTDGNGALLENVLEEDILCVVSDTNPTTTPTWQLSSPAAQTNRLSPAWPGGSGLSTTLSSIRAEASLLSNGAFDESTIANVPEGWTITVGTPGTTIHVPPPEEQTVVIGGTPTGGSYILQWTDAASIARATGAIAYNASGDTVQSALRELPGLERIEVTATGTTPNLTHTVTFTGVAGNVAQLTSVSHLTGGTPTITHATTVGGSLSYRGRGLKITGNGSQLTALNHPLTLSPGTVYALSVWLGTSTGTGLTAGVLEIEIIDAIGGSVIADAAGTDNDLTIDLTALAGPGRHSFTFRLPSDTAFPVYVRLRLSTAITNAQILYVDELAIVEMTQLYNGGPFVAAFASNAALDPGDSFTIEVTNDRSGLVQEWFNRVFDMADRELLLPIAGTTLIPDTVVA